MKKTPKFNTHFLRHAALIVTMLALAGLYT